MPRQESPLGAIVELQNQISGLRTEMIKHIREYSESQVELWRQIPCLVLEADGEDEYRCRVYYEGIWPVNSSASYGSYTVCVDLETGRLVNAFNILEPAIDGDLLRISANELDASKIIEELKGLSAAPHHWSQGERKEEIGQWIMGKRAELGLEEAYTRKKS